MVEVGPDRLLRELSYWNPRLLDSPLAERNHHRYVTFDVDQGGLSNVRLVFEYVAVIAAITGRKLVLPPPQPWYLINNGPKHAGRKEGVTEFSEILDIPALQQIVPVQSTEDFIRESTEHLSIPGEFQGDDCFRVRPMETRLWARWKQWLFDHTEVLRDWNPYETLICLPDRASVDTGRLADEYIDGRKLIELSPWMNAAPVIHFPSNSECRSLGPVATMLASGDDEVPRLSRRLIKHHIRYHPRVFEIASELIPILGCYRYTALHIRRNDFQYKQTRARAEVSWSNISALLLDECPTYIATDEVDEEFRGFFRQKKPVLFWSDLMGKYNGPAIPEKYVGPVEQLICVCASRFVGTDLSTFSSYIVRLRGYTKAPDTASYYHTEKYAGPQPAPAIDGFKGRGYLQENPLFWLDC